MGKIALLFLLAVCCAAPAALAADTDAAAKELIYRVNLGRAADVKLLLTQGASPNALDEKGVPILALAASRKDDEGLNVLKVLIDAGANTETKDKDGQTALFYAAKQGNKAAAIYLMQHGASYYAADNHGDTARNIAYHEGHNDVMDAMDNQVRAQTDQVRQQYEEANKTLEERYKAEAEVIRNQQTALAQEEQKLATEKQSTPKPEEGTGDKTAETPPQPEPGPPKASREQYEPTMKQLAFNNCAFQYWSYVHSIGQSTELSTEALRTAIESDKKDILALNDKLLNTYQVPEKQVSSVSDQAKQRIFDALNIMPSKVYRHENGVGKMDDMRKRCNDISDSWDETAAENKPAPIPGLPPGSNKSGIHVGRSVGKTPPSKAVTAVDDGTAPTPNTPPPVRHHPYQQQPQTQNPAGNTNNNNGANSGANSNPNTTANQPTGF